MLNSTIFKRTVLLILASCLAGLTAPATADWLYYLTNTDDSLNRMHTDTFEIQKIGNVGFNVRGAPGMAWNPALRKLMVLNNPETRDWSGIPSFYLVNHLTGESELIGTLVFAESYEIGAKGLAHDRDTGRTFYSTDSWFFEVNIETLEVREIANLNEDGDRFGPNLDSLAFDSKRNLLVAAHANIGEEGGQFYTVNPNTGEGELLCKSTNGRDNGGLAYDSNKNLFYNYTWDYPLQTYVMWFYDFEVDCERTSLVQGLPSGDGLTFVPDTDFGFSINSGLNDAWFNPATSGQGLLVTVFPDIKQMFLAWFTYDTERPPEDVTAFLGEPGHRWLTAQGPYDGDTATLKILVTEGGVFDSPVPAAETDVAGDGTMTLEFADCENGLVNYHITSLDISGNFPIERIAADNVALCEMLSNP